MNSLRLKYFLLIVISFCFSACDGSLNNPYKLSERGENIFYSSFGTPPPKHLDPAISYSSDEYTYICKIYEPPFDYHYLKRPYQLVPLTAEKLPEPQYFDTFGKQLPQDVDPKEVVKAVYEINIKPGIMYQNHPCFAKYNSGDFRYHDLTAEDVSGIYEVRNFEEADTRELVAADYVYQIKRLAHPKLHCPILSTLNKYILGLEEYADALEKDLDLERSSRKSEQGVMYNQDVDERNNPIKLDLDKHPLAGVELVDRYTYRIVLKKKYPQILYWLAMPFFSPMPWEAIEFYAQGVLLDRNISIDRFPVGTGPYRMDVYDPNMKIVLSKNENYHPDFYPAEGEPDDAEAGLLDDAGQRLPFIDKVIYKLEKEGVSYWAKFLQG